MKLLPQQKIAAFVIGAVILVFITLIGLLHENDIQDFQVVQSPTGRIEVISQGGYYLRLFPKIWTYPKVETVYFSNEMDESKDNDGIKVRFANKGEGDISTQVVYRLYNDNYTYILYI